MNNVINKNENHFMAWLGMGDRNDNERYAVHIPTANKLIEKYCLEWWKNQPGEWNYQFLQFQLCMELAYFSKPGSNAHSREHTIRVCSVLFGVSPLLMHNDPQLPF